MPTSFARLAADFHLAPDAALALALGIGLIIAIGVVVILVLLLRPRKPVADPVAEQRMADLNGRIQAMGELLAKAQSQLQQTVHERLDAVSTRLGDSMQTSTKHTTEHLQQLHARLAVIELSAEEHHRAGDAGLILAGHPRQQAVARRLRPGAAGGDRRRRAAEGRL